MKKQTLQNQLNQRTTPSFKKSTLIINYFALQELSSYLRKLSFTVMFNIYCYVPKYISSFQSTSRTGKYFWTLIAIWQVKICPWPCNLLSSWCKQNLKLCIILPAVLHHTVYSVYLLLWMSFGSGFELPCDRKLHSRIGL